MLTPKSSIIQSCTPHRHMLYHILHQDFLELCLHDLCNTSALRVFEMRTNQRIEYLRRHYPIDPAWLPNDEDLWLDITLRQLESLTLRVCCRSSYARALAERAPEGKPPSLIELGFLKRRFVARPGCGYVALPQTQVYADLQGPFLLVDDEGYYQNARGEKRCAANDGYIIHQRQYLYCIDAVNTALAHLSAEESPRPAPRCLPFRQLHAALPPDESIPATPSVDRTKTTASPSHVAVSTNTAIPSTHPQTSCASSCTTDDALSNTLSSAHDASSDDSEVSRTPLEETTQASSCSLDEHTLCTAEWNVETLLALSGHLLAIPDPPSPTLDSSDESLLSWQTEWYQPALRLLHKTSKVEPRHAWEQINQVIAYMTDPTSPSWWVTGRARQSQIHLRHVANNFWTVLPELQARNWYPSMPIPYNGPPLKMEATYPATTSEQAGEQGAQRWPDPILASSHTPAHTEEKRRPGPPAQRGMPHETAMNLAEHILAAHPCLSLGLKQVDDEHFILGIEYAQDAWLHISQPDDWYVPPPVIQRMVERALRFGESLSGTPAPAQDRDDTQQ